MDKSYVAAYALIESMAQNHYQWGSERGQADKAPIEKAPTKGGMYEISSLDSVHAKVDALIHKIDNLTAIPPATMAAITSNCEICRVPGHAAAECQILAGTPRPSKLCSRKPLLKHLQPWMEKSSEFLI